MKPSLRMHRPAPDTPLFELVCRHRDLPRDRINRPAASKTRDDFLLPTRRPALHFGGRAGLVSRKTGAGSQRDEGVMNKGIAHSYRVTRLLVVDNHPIIHEGLIHMTSRESDLRVDWQALSVEEALTICRDHIPDMAIVGIALGDRSGLDLVKALHARWPLFPILVMSIYDDSLYASRSLRAGACGYIMKHSPAGHIIEAIRKVRDGGTYVSAKAQAQLLESAIAGVDFDVPAIFASLSDRELEIFQLIGKGLKKGEIAALLNRSVNTVESHRANIKKKLKVHTSAELARLAFHCCKND